MKTKIAPKYYIGPYYSCFYAIYAHQNNVICRITGLIGNLEEAEIKLEKINNDPWKEFLGVKRVYS